MDGWVDYTTHPSIKLMHGDAADGEAIGKQSIIVGSCKEREAHQVIETVENT